MRRLAQDPLFAFAIVAACLFWVAPRVEPAATARRSEAPRTADSASDKASLDEELLLHEAFRLGLDRRDPIVRRRLVQLMRALGEATPTPTDAELRAYLTAHPERFRREERLELEQVFVRDGPEAEARFATIQGQLAAGALPAAAGLGDPHPLGSVLRSVTQAQLRARLGGELATAAFGQATGVWGAPVRGLHGTHLVRVRSRTPGQLPDLTAIRAEVLGALLAERRREGLRSFVVRLRARSGLF